MESVYCACCIFSGGGVAAGLTGGAGAAVAAGVQSRQQLLVAGQPFHADGPAQVGRRIAVQPSWILQLVCSPAVSTQSTLVRFPKGSRRQSNPAMHCWFQEAANISGADCRTKGS